MSARRVDYHKGATDDVKTALTWYKARSCKAAAEFVEELDRAVDTILAAPDRWPMGRTIRDAFHFGGFRSPLFTQNKNLEIRSGL